MWSIRAFVDEMEKMAVRLNEDERTRQAIMFTGLGAMSGPAIGGISNLIQHGKFGPATGTSLKRWIPATMASGALISGALPAVRNVISHHIEDQARARLAMGDSNG